MFFGNECKLFIETSKLCSCYSRYVPGTKLWQTLETKLPDGGKSDFSVLKLPSNFKRGIPLNPNMNSGLTKINPGSCRTPDWRNKFNLVSGGKKIVWRTNAAIHAWVQLDLRASVRVVKVRGTLTVSQ